MLIKVKSESVLPKTALLCIVLVEPLNVNDETVEKFCDVDFDDEQHRSDVVASGLLASDRVPRCRR